MEREFPAAADVIYGPDLSPVNLEALRASWQANAPEYTIKEGTGRIPQFAGPQAIAPPLDRQSVNVRDADLYSGLVNLFVGRPVRNLIGLSQWADARLGLSPPVTMQEIGDLLPKEPTPDFGPRR